MRSRATTIALTALMIVSGCSSEPGGDEDPAASASSAETAGDDSRGMDGEQYCQDFHGTDLVAAEPVAGGVEVRWYRYPEPSEPTTFTVYRREAGTAPWQALEEVVRDDVDDLTYVDATATAGSAYEYTVTVHDAGCGGESEICDERPCTVPTVVAREP